MNLLIFEGDHDLSLYKTVITELGARFLYYGAIHRFKAILKGIRVVEIEAVGHPLD